MWLVTNLIRAATASCFNTVTLMIPHIFRSCMRIFMISKINNAFEQINKCTGMCILVFILYVRTHT